MEYRFQNYGRREERGDTKKSIANFSIDALLRNNGFNVENESAKRDHVPRPFRDAFFSATTILELTRQHDEQGLPRANPCSLPYGSQLLFNSDCLIRLSHSLSRNQTIDNNNIQMINYNINNSNNNNKINANESSTRSAFRYHHHNERRRRCSFNAAQTRFLEAEFARNRYVSAERRRAVAHLLGITQQQVKIWYQNRRYKTKVKAAASAIMLA